METPVYRNRSKRGRRRFAWKTGTASSAQAKPLAVEPMPAAELPHVAPVPEAAVVAPPPGLAAAEFDPAAVTALAAADAEKECNRVLSKVGGAENGSNQAT